MDITVVSLVGLSLFALCQMGVILHDLTQFRIPNIYPVVMILSFTLLAVVNESILPFASLDLVNHVVCGLVLLLLGFSLFSLRIIGGGDAKIAAATGLWFGWPLVLDYLIYASLVGAVLAVITVTFKLAPISGRGSEEGVQGKTKYVPFGVGLGISALIVSTYAPLFDQAIAYVKMML